MRRLLLPLAVAGVLVVLRRDLVVRGIRELDRRGGLASNRGERAYAGTSRLFAALHERCVSDTMAAERGVDELEGAAEALPMADGSVDVAISTLSMHHWTDPTAAFGELRRVLRAGGTARIYDVRFAAYGPAEVARFATAAGLDPARVEREILPERLFGLRPYVRITVHAPHPEESIHAG